MLKQYHPHLLLALFLVATPLLSGGAARHERAWGAGPRPSAARTRLSSTHRFGVAASDGVRHTAGPASSLVSTTTISPCIWQALDALHIPFTDLHAHYWAFWLRADPQMTLTVTGTYPAARYASIQAYAPQGRFLAGLTDRDFPPDSGSVNPFVAGTQRGTGTYILHVVFGPAPAQAAPGTLYLNVPAGMVVNLWYRIYLPDAAATSAGNVPLPTVTAQRAADGTAVACPQYPLVPPTATPSPAPTVAPALPSATPTPIPTVGFVRVAAQSLGGYGNADAAYLLAQVPPAPGLYVVRFQAPTTPHTLLGGPLDPTTQLRYWSLCLLDSTAQPYSCPVDEQVPTDANGDVTVVLGPWWARPANATIANGIVWLNLGWFTKPYWLMLRQLLPAPTFTTTAFAVPPGASPGPYMGAYAPTIVTCSTAQFQLDLCRSTAAVPHLRGSAFPALTHLPGRS